MLTDQDVLLLKLALERELLDSQTYRQVLETVRKGGSAGGVGRALRQVGIAGERVGELAELVALAGKDPTGVILARADLEDALVARALERSKIVEDERLERAKNEQRGLGRTGELASLTEILVRRRLMEVPVAIEYRRRARERVSTCPKCRRHYIVEPDKIKEGRYKCRECNVPLGLGTNAHSAVEYARGIVAEKPPPPIEASQLVQMSPEQMKELREARERGMQKERERLAAARAVSSTSEDLKLRVPPNPSSSGSGSGVVPPRTPTPQPAAASSHVKSGTGKIGAPLSGTTVALGAAAPRTPTPAPPDRLARAEKATVSDGDEKKQAELRAAVAAATKSPDEDSTPSTARWDSVDSDKADVTPPSASAVAMFGEYEILSEIARGGMGIVYKARRKGAQKLLALKVLISGVDATPEQVQRFEAEGENARKLRHPGIVRVYDAGRHEGYHYIAMEFVTGQTLEEVLTKGAMDPRRAAKVIRDVARAVDHIHKANIIHRDLKPGNVILNDADEPKLIDFGLAKAIDRRAKLTRSGAAIGTPYYMPPEQVRGESDKIGPASDVYALGAILFEMIAGEVPFRAENPIELYHKIASSELTLPSQLKEGLPDDLVTIVAKSMEKAPENRYATAAELADDLDRFLNGEEILGTLPEKSDAQGPAGRGRTVLAILAAIAFALVAAVIVVAKYAPRASEPWRAMQDKGRQALVARNPDQAKVFFETAITLMPTEPTLEVDLARSHAGLNDKESAFAALGRAVEKGLDDASTLDAFDLKSLADDPRFAELRTRVQERRK